LKHFFSRIAGYVLIGGAIFGILISALGLFTVWRNETILSTRLLGGIDQFSETLVTTGDSLNIIATSLDTARQKINLIQDTTQNLSDAIGATTTTIQSLGDLFGTNLPNVVNDTQQALAGAQTASVLIDDTLKIISAIPFIGARYEPETSLGTSISSVSLSLGKLPETFSEIKSGFDSTSANLLNVQTNVDELTTSISEIDSNLADAQDVVLRYQQNLELISSKLDNLKTDLPGWLKFFALGISIVLLWIAFASVGLFSQGVDLIKKKDD
jgi:methyl-accepting chemotaxis protein